MSNKLEEYDSSSPVGKISIIVELRDMFNHATVQDAIEAINYISDENHLKVLIGVGMKGVLYYKLAQRRGELLGI